MWSAGCASGEEAYTLAIVLAEALGDDAFRERVKIYATDVDEDALADARARRCTARKESRACPTELRERTSSGTTQRYAFRKDLRRTVIFGRNDLVQDAPISRVDLLVCRNTLMYFNAETQAADPRAASTSRCSDGGPPDARARRRRCCRTAICSRPWTSSGGSS